VKIKDDESLAEFFIRYSDAPGNEDKTVEDFFEAAGVPEDSRSDFAFSAILNQVAQIEGQQEYR